MSTCRRMNSCRRDPERPLFKDSAGGMILNELVWEINGNGNKCRGWWWEMIDQMQKRGMHRGLDRFGPHGGVTPYSCVSAISILEGNSSRMYLVTGVSCLQRA